MAVDYPGAIDKIITDPAWVFTDALASIPSQDLTIVLHKTACGNPCTATDVANFFHNDIVEHKSVHFIVGRDGSVIQIVQLKDGAGGNCCLEIGHEAYWTPFEAKYGNLNRCTISIEHEDWTTDNSQAMTSEQVKASFALVLWLVRKYKLFSSQIKGHNSLDPISRSRCPGPTYPMDALVKGMSVNNFLVQAAKDTWNSVAFPVYDGITFLGFRPLRYNSGIALAWQADYISGRNMPPPTTNEFVSCDWAGNPIVVQMFGTLRCEWYNGTAHWLPTFTG